MGRRVPPGALKPFLRRLGAVPAWAWLALAAALRVAFVLKLGGRLYQTDEAGFESAAWNLASTGTLGSGSGAGVVPPVPAFFFGFFYLFGRVVALPRLGSALVGTATAGLIGRMTEDLSGSRAAGRAALIVSCVYPFFVYYSGMLLSETLYIACVVPGLWLLCRCLRGGASDWRSGAAAGALLSAAALCRAEAGPIAVFLWLGLAAMAAFGRASWKGVAAAVLCWTIPLGAYALRNHALTGRFVTDTHGGATLLLGTRYFELNEVDTTVAKKALDESPLAKETASLPQADQDAAYTRAAFRFMRDNPGLTVRQWGRKLVNFWRFAPRADKAFLQTAVSRPAAGFGRRTLALVSLAFEPWLIVGGLWGLWALRWRWAVLLPIGWFVVGTTGLHMIVVSQMRYRLPVMPFLIFALFAALSERLETPVRG